jgi:ABC-type multidrug transport system ATPase subunit
VCDRVAIVDRGGVVAELGMAELVRESGVRVLVTGLPDAGAIAGRFGQARLDGEWLVVDSIADGKVPALVAELVSHGGAVHAVVPERHTLEERFLSLLGAAPDEAAEGARDVAVPASPELRP